MRNTSLKLLFLGAVCSLCFAPAKADLKLHYTFDSSENNIVHDMSGNDYHGTLKNGAKIEKLDQYSVLNLGDADGYLDMGSKVGDLISTITNITISAYIYIGESTDLSSNGNFVYTFSNSTDLGNQPKGAIFYSARAQRYAISKTNWQAESAMEVGQQLPKSEWKHIAYVQNGTFGRLYLDGALVKSGSVSIAPKELGKTLYNFIGRSPYVGDAYLKNAKIADFRVYDNATSSADVAATLVGDLEGLRQASYKLQIIEAQKKLQINNGETDVIKSFILPYSISGGFTVSWSSSKPSVISTDGNVNRPAIGNLAEDVILTATITKSGLVETKTFALRVLPSLSDESSVQKDIESLTSSWQVNCIRTGVVALLKSGEEGSVITWMSNNPDFITDEGLVLKLPATGSGDKIVSLKATFTKGSKAISKDLDVCIKEDEGFTAYLFAYFTGNSGDEEAVRFALSRDGYGYRALNGNKPIIASDTISDMGGVRDPHILRGEDGNFYMVITDMKSDLGWNSNHGIILLKSKDLVNWTSSKIDIKAKYPQFSTIQSAWAPQSIYDSEVGKYMVYWSMRSPGVHEIIYYAYTNSDFTDFEAEPKVLFNHPDSKSTIDGDIIYKDGKYNLFFKTEGDGNGIKKAISNKLTEGYILQDKYLQQTTQAVEGSCVFRLTNTDSYILMYDVYANGRYEFTESNDLENFKKIDDTHISMDFHPRHGTVIPITEEEGIRLSQKWGGAVSTLDVFGSSSEAVKTNNWTKTGTEIMLPVKAGTDLTSFDPRLKVLPGVEVSPEGAQNFTSGAVAYTLSTNGEKKIFTVDTQINANPVLSGYYADPEILYSEKNNKYYIYPTTDGFAGWGSKSFKTFSSPDLVNWTDEGEMLVLGNDVKWASQYAWAPCIIEKKISDNEYKFYYYFTAAQKIGVAVANDPTGPFVDRGTPLISTRPAGVSGGQEIDPDVFFDPVSKKSYIYWGNGYLAVAELNDDMMSVKEGTIKVMTPSDGTFREGIYVFYRNGKYYFFWSEDDTGSENYKVRYGTSDNPLGPIAIPANNIVVQKDTQSQIYGTGHCSVLQIPNKDEWYVVYHRFARPRVSDPGQHREVCIDRLEFNADGTIKQMTPTLKGIVELGLSGIEELIQDESKVFQFYPNPAKEEFHIEGQENAHLMVFNSCGQKVCEKKSLSNNETIGIGTLTEGVYVLVLKDKLNNLKHAKLIKCNM